MSRHPPAVLTIAGSDSGGGAGVQADLRALAAFGVHGCSAITALTAQDTRGVHAIHVPPVGFLRAQIDAAFGDFDVRAVKLGMLVNAEVVDTVADALEFHQPAHVVLDPVLASSSGTLLLQPDAIERVRGRLIAKTSVLTPNAPEAQVLAGGDPVTPENAERVARGLLALGAEAVLLKGAHLDEGEQATDRYLDARGQAQFSHPRLPFEVRGTGCLLASAIAARLALGDTPRAACATASDWLARQLPHAAHAGAGARVLVAI